MFRNALVVFSFSIFLVPNHCVTVIMFRNDTLAAIASILEKTSRHEIEVEKRFRLLQRMANSPSLLADIQQFTMVPIRVDIPEVSNGFVYLLVSLRAKGYRTTYVGECVSCLLVELSRHNSGVMEGITQKLHLRPWTIAAFAFNFPNDHSRILLKDRLHFNADMNFRADVLQNEFANLCMSGEFGCVSFVRCGFLRESRPF